MIYKTSCLKSLGRTCPRCGGERTRYIMGSQRFEKHVVLMGFECHNCDKTYNLSYKPHEIQRA